MVAKKDGKMARPTKMTEVTLGKLEQAFAYDSSIEEACFYADINPDTYYAYVKAHPEFSERVKALRNRPVLDARQKVVSSIKADVKVAQWYLERKAKKEYGANVDITSEGEKLEGLVIVRAKSDEDTAQ